MTPIESIDPLLSKRLVGERLREEHAEWIVSLHRDERVMATLGGVRSREDSLEFVRAALLHWQEHDFGFWIWRDRESGEPVARAGIRRVEIPDLGPEVEIAYAVIAERWGQGLATELACLLVETAFDRLGLGEVVAFTLHDNHASRRVMEKAGLRYERDILWADLPHTLHRIRANER